MDLDKLSAGQLSNLIENYRKRGMGDHPTCREAEARLQALKPRKVSGPTELDLARTREAIQRAAAKGRYLSYGAIAEANGIEWHQFAVIHHLTDLCKDAHARSWPLLSAIVVNQKNLDTGALDPESLAGFIRVAEALGYTIADQQGSLREQQEKTFVWAQASSELQG